MGAHVSRRYKYGLQPRKYFNNKVMPELKETFGILDFNYKRAYELFRAFIAIDFDNSGEITVAEFHNVRRGGGGGGGGVLSLSLSLVSSF